jgi:hypothetical protein
MKNRTHGSDLFTDTESFLSELSMHEESLLSGGCGKSVKNKSGKKCGQSKKSGSGKSRSGCGIPVVIPPVVVGLGY